MNKKFFDKVVSNFLCAKDKNGEPLKLVSLIYSDTKDYFIHDFVAKTKIDIRSISKPIVCMAFGAAIADGLKLGGETVGLDTKIWPLMSGYCHVEEANQLAQLSKWTLRDCFRLTLGHDKGIMFSGDVKGQDEYTLMDYVVNYPITEEISKHFVYSNAGAYILSGLITEHLGIGLDEFVDKYIFSELGITDFSWRKYGKYCAGCTGLEMYNEDLHKLGKLIINDGIYNGKRIVPKNWIDLMRTPAVQAPTHRYIATRAYPKWSYGFDLWISESGEYYCDGSDGQYLLFLPQKNAVVSLTARQKDTVPVSEILGLFK